MKFRKKPVVIEAIQFDGSIENASEILKWGGPGCGMGHRYTSVPGVPGVMVIETLEGEIVMVIETLEGEMRAMPGDWIIRGVNGEHYPCKPDIFEATYERVSELT